MARWFRMHESTLDDPKVQQRLSDSQFRAWVNLLCLACRHDGVLPPLVDIAFALRRTEKEAAKVIAELIKHELIDETETGIEPHNWNGRQYKSDVSNERVKRHRQRVRNVTSNVTETSSDVRDRTEQISEANASAGKVPAREVIFNEALPWLIRKTGKTRAQSATLLGGWCRDFGDEAVLAALTQAEQENPVEPISWIAAKFKPRPDKGQEIRDAIARGLNS